MTHATCDRKWPKHQFDIIIIGSGPGGYVTAIRAAQLGFKTAIVEREHLGGICLNWGCIPTKALLRSAEIYHYMKHAKDYGLSAENVGFDRGRRRASARAPFPGGSTWGSAACSRRTRSRSSGARRRSPSPAKSSCRNQPRRRCSRSMPPPRGRARRRAPTQAKHIIIATGARPRVLPGLEPDGKLVWTYFEAMVPPEMPKSLLVVGSGAIGIEFASFYNAMGVDVTVVEIVDQIMPVEDAEIAKIAQKQLEKHGLKIKTGAKVSALKKGADNRDARRSSRAAQDASITVDRVISAVGVVGNIENLGLEALGVKTEKGTIVVDGFGRTNVAGHLCDRRCRGSADAGAQGRA